MFILVAGTSALATDDAITLPQGGWARCAGVPGVPASQTDPQRASGVAKNVCSQNIGFLWMRNSPTCSP